MSLLLIQGIINVGNFRGNNMNLIERSIAEEIIFQGLSLGADFVDVFIEKTHSEGIIFKNSKAEDIQSGTIFGIGIRLIHGEQALYGYTNSTDKEELLRVTSLLGARIGNTKKVQTLNFEKLSYPKIPVLKDKEVSIKDKVALLTKIDSSLRTDQLTYQVNLNYIKKNKIIEIYNSDELYASEERPNIRLGHQVVMKEGSLQSEAFHGPGAIGGWDFVE